MPPCRAISHLRTSLIQSALRPNDTWQVLLSLSLPGCRGRDDLGISQRIWNDDGRIAHRVAIHLVEGSRRRSFVRPEIMDEVHDLRLAGGVDDPDHTLLDLLPATVHSPGDRPAVILHG